MKDAGEKAKEKAAVVAVRSDKRSPFHPRLCSKRTVTKEQTLASWNVRSDTWRGIGGLQMGGKSETEKGRREKVEKMTRDWM